MQSIKGRGIILAAFLTSILSAACPLCVDVGTVPDGCVGGSVWLIPVGLLPPGSTDATLRFGDSFTCHLAVTPGNYEVTLRFVEPAIPGDNYPGHPPLSPIPHRVFSATVNGVLAADRLELLTTAERTVKVLASIGQIDVTLVMLIRSAVLSSIDVKPIVDSLPSGLRIVPGFGIITTQVEGSNTIQIGADGASMLSLVSTPDKPEPDPNAGCNVSPGVVVGQGGVYFCVAILPLSQNPNPWGHWRYIKFDN